MARTERQDDLVWQQRLDALASGECSEDDFMDELATSGNTSPDSAWDVVALLDQRYRRGQIPVDLFRSIESRIAQRELGVLDAGTTVDLDMDLDLGSPQPPVTPAASPAPAAPPPPPQLALRENASPVAAVGRELRNRYVLEARLGSGGMGTVFKASDRYRCDLPEDNRHVAIKLLHEKIGGHPQLLSKLRREFYCAQALSHPNIVKVYELDQDDDVAFFTMEFLEGELLERMIERSHPLAIPRSAAWPIIFQVGAGLAHAHSRNVVHADLKPRNVIITRSGEARILDFGASSAGGAVTGGHSNADTMSKDTSTALTPAYASCELLEGRRPDPRDDLYALACLTYELLSGAHPFQGRRSVEARQLGLVPQRPEGLTEAQWRTLAMGLAWRREDRSMAVGDWIAALNPPPTRTPIASRSIARVAVPLTLVLVGLIIWFSYGRQPVAPKLAADASNAAAHATVATPTTIATTTGTASGTATTTAAAAITPATAAAAVAVAVAASGVAAESPAATRAVSMQPPDDTNTVRTASKTSNTTHISISNASYRMGSRQNFAEIHVHRSSGPVGDTSFVWKTQPASALPDVDYVPQAPVTQLLPKGRHAASVFVKLIPNPSRKHAVVFYVTIGEPGNGATLGRVTRAAIILRGAR